MGLTGVGVRHSRIANERDPASMRAGPLKHRHFYYGNVGIPKIKRRLSRYVDYQEEVGRITKRSVE